MAHNRPGESTHSPEEWKDIHPVFRTIYMDHGCSLERTRMILELAYNFFAPEGAFRRQIRQNWRDCATNTKKARGNRTRSKIIKVKLPDFPDYIDELAIGEFLRSINRSLVSRSLRLLPLEPFDGRIRVLLSLDKYIKGFFDSSASRRVQQGNGAVQDANSTENKSLEQKPAVGGRWRRALSLCQEISILPQKKKDIIDFDTFPDEIDTNRAIKEEGIQRMKNIATGILKTKIFTKLEVIENGTTPSDLPTLWSVCRVLRGLSFQLGYFKDSEGLLMRLLLEELWKLYAQITEGPNTEMGRALEHLRNIASEDLKYVACISCLCSARALSSRLKPYDPVVLQVWLDYYQHYDKSSLRKDVFLCHYERAYGEANANQQITRSRTDGEKVLLVLMDYCYVAHYVCHDRALAYRLSSELWNLTGAILAGEQPPKAWSIEVQGMAEAAKIQALVCYIKHEDKLKSREDLKVNKIHKYNLASRQSRRKYRRAVLQDRQMNHVLGYLPPYDPEAQAQIGLQEMFYKLIFSPKLDFQLLATQLQDLLATLLDTKTQAIENLEVAIRLLHNSNDTDCQLLAAGLYDQLASITCACSQDVNSVLQSVKSLFKKANDSPLTEKELSDLKGFLEKEAQARRMQGENHRDSAKDLRRLVMVFDAYIDLDQFISYQ
ncbi:uncharacterized protein FFB20_05534 [Fusarium fujikuroi]|uniref:Clr5 domain-containing protein n=2 Tax=Fusarium fujikuroi TaxID=5127 RepID=S0ECY4_GIBF5|nr:uncharacterized protein FFUJ_12631 [Fusarium fujikuroi IMI 58289]KLP10294.1 uncharacterized protein Y057_1897 [Fusarium fujikuroi]KLP19944.1 uncharacterized protein LW94_1357 [Fusarium fujikuroi]QGI68376.1 hypothetical protein CEK27_012347 [Fusarium fujikuroi]QGI85588.1 hypothetical protein CEK25_012317 [Fusarium fujikuroi]QGI99269.1 hypothetical protein CEK26_012338 [Fusarium fujikuroi]